MSLRKIWSLRERDKITGLLNSASEALISVSCCSSLCTWQSCRATFINRPIIGHLKGKSHGANRFGRSFLITRPAQAGPAVAAFVAS